MLDISLLIIGYNRPDHLSRVLTRLLEFNDLNISSCYIFIDGPSDHTLNSKCYSIALQFSSNFAVSTNVFLRPSNIGLRNNIVQSVSHVLNHHDAVIVLEDDIYVHEYFFDYMCMSLDKYNKSSIGHINSHVPIKLHPDLCGVYLSTQMDCWGWATWAHKWKFMSIDPTHLYNIIHSDPEILRDFTLNNSNSCIWQLRANITGKLNTWAVLWQATLSIHRLMCIYPSHSLIKNIGLDGSGTNCHTLSNPDVCDELHPPSIPVKNLFALNTTFNALLASNIAKSIPSLSTKIINRIMS